MEKWFLERVVFQVIEVRLLENTKSVKSGIRYNWYWYP